MKNQAFFMQLLATVIVGVCLAACGGTQKPADEEGGGAGGGAPTAQEQAEQYMGMAGMALSEGDEQGALANYLAAADIYDKSGGVTIERAEAHFLAADLAYKLQEHQQAIDEYEKSVDIYLRFSGNSKIKAANALNNMGTIYKELLKKTRAIDCWTRALEIYREAPAELRNEANMQKIEQNIRDLEQGF